MTKLTIVVPCFNEEGSLHYYYQETTAVLKQNALIDDYEILFVDDGSKDSTLDILKSLAGEDPKVKYLSFSRNFGKEAALLAGFKNASGDYVVSMDADMQDPPSLLPKMLEILQEGNYDSVAAWRSDRQGESKVRSWFARRFYKVINRISDTEIKEGARDYRMMKREMVDAIISLCEYNRFTKGIYSWVGFKTYWLSFENVERYAGKTKWSFWGLFRYGVDGIVSFSQAPLSAASWMGLVLTVVSVIALIFIIVRKLLFGDPVAGWASTMCVIVFLGGIQLSVLGIIGQYIAKMYLEVKKRPHYIIAETNRPDTKKTG